MLNRKVIRKLSLVLILFVSISVNAQKSDSTKTILDSTKNSKVKKESDDVEKKSTDSTIIDTAKDTTKIEAEQADTLKNDTALVVVEDEESIETIEELSATFGKLTITTDPDSATVIFDDTEKGITPIIIDSITPGKHSLVIKKGGYFVKKVSVNTKIDTDSKLNFNLVKPATLVVLSTPEKAVVSLNDKMVGETPFTTKTLKPKEYKLSLQLVNRETIDTTILLENGAIDTLSFKFKTTSSTDTTIQSDSAVVAVDEAAEKEKRIKKILNFVSIGIFAAFTAIVLIIELSHN